MGRGEGAQEGERRLGPAGAGGSRLRSGSGTVEERTITTLGDIARASREVAATPARREKIARLALLLRGLSPAERPVVTAWLAGELPQGRIGVGYAGLRQVLGATAPAAVPRLTAADVDGALGEYAAARGAGSGAVRRRLLGALLGAATEEERAFLAGLLLGELRQGALEGVLMDAVAQAAGVSAGEVRRAAMLAGALPPVAAAVLAEGAPALAAFRLRLMEPVQPMLAQPAADVRAALAALAAGGAGKRPGSPGRGGEDEALDAAVALEWKLDGARVQVHRDGDRVRVFTRSLRDVTAALPEVVAVTRALPARRLILDGEALAVRADGTPEPFQQTMRRFGRKQGVDALAPDLPLTAFFFDLLHLDGEDLLSRGNAARHAELARVVPEAHRVPRRVTADPAEAEAFLAEALARGQEGLVAKALDAPYEAGRRGGAWLKVKRAHTLDLVVLAVEPGSGRRRGWLSNLHLGARDPATGGLVMLGKTFKGMTDAMLAWQTERLRALSVGEPDGGDVVRVRPELVVEVAFDGIQASPRYPGGLALRFARVRRYREDKRAEDADTIETVRALYAQQGGDAPGGEDDL